MTPLFSDKDPARRLAMAPFLLGMGAVAFGVLMIFCPRQLIELLVRLLGVGVLVGGVGLMLFGLNLWRGLSDVKRHVRIEQWRFWKSQDK